MLLVLSKIMALPFYPLSLVVGCGIAAAILLLVQKTRAGLLFAGLSLLLLCFFSAPLFSHILLRSLEGRFDQQGEYPQSSAIVILGGGAISAIAPRRYVEVADAGDRVLYGARLFKAGFAPWIIVTGGKVEVFNRVPTSEAQEYFELLTQICCIDSASIILEGNAQNTHDHAAEVEQILRQKNLPKDIILVTSALHMPRSVGVFKKSGFSVHPAPTDFHATLYNQFSLINLLPQPASLLESTSVLHEYYGIIAYRLFKWI